MFNEQFTPDGVLFITLRDRGRVVAEHRVRNLITRAGRRLLASYLTGGQEPLASLSIGIGRGVDEDAPDLDDTALKDRVETQPATVTGPDGEGDPTLVINAEFPANPGDGASVPLREAGIFVGVVGEDPVLFNRVVFDVIHKSSNLEMSLAWRIGF